MTYLKDIPDVVINGHGHLLPEPQDIPRFMQEKKIFWIGEDRKNMFQGDWIRPVTHPSFFLNEKLEWMDETGVDHMAIITLSQLYSNGLKKKVAMDVIRFQNDFHASVLSRFPEKFSPGFVVQPAFVEEALLEIERCTDRLGLSLLCLPTHFLNANGQWKCVFSEETAPIFELANERSLAVEIHPYDAPHVVNLEDEHWRFHLVWMPAMTADAYHFFSLKDFPDRYPNIRTCFAHGNIMGQINIGRRRQGFLGRPDKFEGCVDPKKTLGKSNVFFDTLTHDPKGLGLIKANHGVDQIILGLDDPYPLGEMDGIENGYPGQVINEAVKNQIITKEEERAICSTNVSRWLFGERETSFDSSVKNT